MDRIYLYLFLLAVSVNSFQHNPCSGKPWPGPRILDEFRENEPHSLRTKYFSERLSKFNLCLSSSSDIPVDKVKKLSDSDFSQKPTQQKDEAFFILNNKSFDGSVHQEARNNNLEEIKVAPSTTELLLKLEALESKLKLQEATQTDIEDVLDACISSEDWNSLRRFFNLLSQNPKAEFSTLYSKALKALCRHNNASLAVDIMRQMHRQNELTISVEDIHCTALALCQEGQFKMAILVLQEFGSNQNNSNDTNPNRLSHGNVQETVSLDVYDLIMGTLARKGAWKEALNFLDMMERDSAGFHPRPQLSIYGAAIDACVAAIQAEPASKVLLSMPSKGMIPNLVSYENVIAACAKRQNWRRALQIFSSLKQVHKGQTIHVETYNSVIACCAKAGEVHHAMTLLEEMRQQDHTSPTVMTYNSIMSVCAGSSRMWKDALRLLDECNRQPGVEPDIYTYTIAMRACARGRQTSRALTLFQVARDKGLPLDVYAYTSVMDACAKGGKWKTALNLLDDMRQSGIQPNGYTYSVAIAACGNGGQWERALELLYQMRDKKIPINIVTYNAAITALAKAASTQMRNSRIEERRTTFSGNLNPASPTTLSDDNCEDIWSKVLKLLGQMKKDGVEPDAISYSSAIRACGAAGQWHEALELIKIMQKGGPNTKPNRIAYTNAIIACGRSGEYEPAIQLFNQMRNDGLHPDRVSYNALINCLKDARKPEIVIQLWDEMCGRGPPALGISEAAAEQYSKSIEPDIITVTDVIASLKRSGTKYLTFCDKIFKEAVELNIILKADALDSSWEIDLSGMSFPVAQSAVRYVLTSRIEQEHKKGKQDEENIHDLTFITGVGQQYRGQNHDRDGNTPLALREYIRDSLRDDYSPPIYSKIPEKAQGTVVIKQEMLMRWLAAQS